MSVQRPNLVKATCFALSLTGAAAVLATATMPDFAYAKNSKSNSASSNSQGGGSKSSKSQGGGSKSSKSQSGGSKSSTSRGGGSKSSKSQGSASRGSKSQASGQGSNSNDAVVRTSKSKKSKAVKSARQTKPAGSKKIKTKKLIGGVHPSALGALNAAHASEQALLHASPNSRVGRIATYRDLVVDGKPLFDDLEDAQTALEDIDARVDENGNVIPPEAIYVERYDATTEFLTETDADQLEIFEGLNTDLKDALLDGNEDAIAAAQTALDDYYVAAGVVNNDIATLNDDHDAAIEYENAVTDIDELQDLVDDQKLLETEALQAAANKPVTEEIEYAVKEMLGLNGE